MTNLTTLVIEALEYLGWFEYRICKGSPLTSVGMPSQEKQQDKEGCKL